MYQQLGLDAGKLVFKACDQVRLKPAFSATESSLTCFLYVLTLIFGDSLSIINFSKIYCSAYIVFSSVFFYLKKQTTFIFYFLNVCINGNPGIMAGTHYAIINMAPIKNLNGSQVIIIVNIQLFVNKKLMFA